jgi:hypothetical protein
MLFWVSAEWLALDNTKPDTENLISRLYDVDVF